MSQGWICPRYQKVNAPWMPSCNCHTTSINVTIGRPVYDWNKVPSSYDTSEPRTAKRPCPSCHGTGVSGRTQVCSTCRGAKEI